LPRPRLTPFVVLPHRSPRISTTVYHGSPVIFLTLNPGERDSPITLKYAGKKSDVRKFYPEWYSETMRLRTALSNPLAVVDYFHQTVNAIIEKVLKGGLFGELAHFYGTVEYQGCGTPHAHILVSSFSMHSDFHFSS